MKILMVVLAVAALAGCAAGQPVGGAPATTENDKKVQHVKCLREHGIPVELAGDGNAVISEENRPDESTMAAAEKACAKYHPLGPPPSVGSAAWDAMLKYAQCLRQNGVDVKDPQPGDHGVRMGGDGQADEQTMEKAQEACRQYRPKRP
jgi:hypothetical protein